MNRIKILLMLAATTLLAASCIKDEPTCSTCDENPDGKGIYLSFNDGSDTRSNLNSSEVDYKDVKDVYLYVFNADATCILSEDVDWQGDIQQKHWISTDLNAGDYTFLAVGVDDNAGSVYGLTANYQGKTLGECMARLATDKGKTDMATAQFFAGHTTQTVDEEDDVVEVGITLRRKVAGVLVYLKNIPYQVGHQDANDKATVTDLRLTLGSDQNTQMPLWKATTETNPIYGSAPLADSEVLFDINLASAGYTPDADKRYYTKPGIQEDELQTLDNSLLLGAFLLPLQSPGENSTLNLELLGEYTTGSGDEHQGEILKTYTIQNQIEETSFPLDENHLYSIGKKLSNSSTDGDKPADLSGNILQVEVVEWCEHDIPNNFPSVNAPARVVGDYNPENYIFDAPGTTFTVEVFPATPNPQPWTMCIRYGDEENEPNNGLNKDEKDWIHIIGKDAQGNVTGYLNELTNAGTEIVTIDLILNDFAVKRNISDNTPNYNHYSDEEIEMAKNDYRTAYIQIKTQGQEGAPYELKVRQYNTLSVKTSNPSYPYIGTSRLDYGCYFSKETGTAICAENSNPQNHHELGHTLNHWGFTGSANIVITGEPGDMDTGDGETNLNKTIAEGSSNYEGSMMWKARKEIINIINNKQQETGRTWYLPAYQEMYAIRLALTDNKVESRQLFNMGWTDKSYWTSTGLVGFPYKSYSVYIGGTVGEEKAERETYHPTRPIRKFLD